MAFILLLAFAGTLNLATSTFTVSTSYYSGREDPVWNITDKDGDFGKISALYKDAVDKNAVFPNNSMPSRLGYRGIMISQDYLKTWFDLVGNKSFDLQVAIVNNGIARKEISEIVGSIMIRAIINETAKPVDRSKSAQLHKRATNYPAANNHRWRHWAVQYCNNCYNYGTNIENPVMERFAQPGLYGGNMYPRPITRDGVRDAAVRDGLVLQAPGGGGAIPAPPLNSNLVALVVAPDTTAAARDGDFHWYRLDSDNTWSHKPGSTPVTNVDGWDDPIADPRRALNNPFGPQYQFVTFMSVNPTAPTVHILGSVNVICLMVP